MTAAKAFSLVELMVVIAVVGVISAVAIPAYKNYSNRVKITEGINAIQPYINKALEFQSKNGVFPPVNKIFTPLLTWTQDGAPTADSGLMPLDVGVVSMIEYVAYPSIGFPNNVALGVGFKNSFTGATAGQWQDKKLYFILSSQPNGTVKIGCGNWAAGHIYNLTAELVPANCTETDILGAY